MYPAPAENVGINSVFPQDPAYPVYIAGFNAFLALIIHFIGTGFAVSVQFLEAVGKQGNLKACTIEFFPVKPVHNFKFQHIQVVLLPACKKILICDMFPD